MPDSTGTTGTTDATGTATGTGATGTTGATDQTGDKLGEGGVKALQAERARASALEAQLRERDARIGTLESAGKSESDQLKDRLATLERQASESAATALRYRIAGEHSIAPADAETFLTGADEATMRTQAARLVELQGTQAGTAGEGSTGTTGTPKPDPSQGNQGGQGGKGGATPLNGDGLLDALKSKLNIP